MHVYRKIEIPGLFSATLVVIQLVLVMLVWKWKASTAKKEEIRKLVVMAANETSMVEEEYMVNSNKLPTTRYECAVCFTVAGKRCSRCKTVRYCSGKCQIMHWRQGHKEECRPLGICNSFSSVSTDQEELNLSSSLVQSKEPGSPECDLQGQNVSSSPVQHLHHFNSETLEISSSDLPDVSSSHIEQEVISEVPRPSCSKVTDSAPNASNKSNDCSREAVLGTIPTDANVMLTSEISSNGDPIGCSLYTSNILNNSKDIAPCRITSTIDSTNSVLDIPGSGSRVRNSSHSTASGSTTGFMTGSISSDHDIHSCMFEGTISPISESPTLGSRIHMGASNNIVDSSSSEHNPSPTESPFHDSTSIESHVMDVCRHNIPIQESPENMPMVAEPFWRSFSNDNPDFEISSSVMENCDGRLLQFSDDTYSSSNDTYQPRITMSPEFNNSVSQHGTWSSEGSVSKGAFKRSLGTAIKYLSRQKAKVPTTTSSYMNACNNAMELPQNNISGLRSSIKKVVRRVKSSKTSKQTDSKTVEVFPKPIQILFPYEYFVELFNSNTLELYPCGLINCGNSCYANVVLQCLIYTRPLAAYLLKGYHAEYCKRKNWCLMCELEHLILMVRQSRSPVSPARVLSRIQKMRTHLGYGRQEDAHELLRLSVDAMQSICLDETGGESGVNPKLQKTTFIQQMFGGCLHSKVRCMRCQYQSEQFENMLDLTVEIHGNIESLEDALAQFTAPELLDGENKYKCERCKSYVKAKKQLIVHEAPNILTIALKRFENGKYGKLNKHVTFPEYLDLSPYMSGTADKPPQYALYAVIVHLDMLNASFFGHYVCYVKDFCGAWYKIDDTEVQPVHIDMVMAEGAYMLLYSRSSPRPPYILENGVFQACLETLVDHPTYDSRESLAANGCSKSFYVNDTGFSSVNLTANKINEIDSDMVWSSDDYASYACVNNRYNVDEYGFSYESIPSATRNWGIHTISREYPDLTYSDTGSLFSGSDEASWSTDSYRDSISTAGSC